MHRHHTVEVRSSEGLAVPRVCVVDEAMGFITFQLSAGAVRIGVSKSSLKRFSRARFIKHLFAYASMCACLGLLLLLWKCGLSRWFLGCLPAIWLIYVALFSFCIPEYASVMESRGKVAFAFRNLMYAMTFKK